MTGTIGSNDKLFTVTETHTHTLRTIQGIYEFAKARDLDKLQYNEALNDYTNNSETILLCNRCACNWEIDSQTINVCSWQRSQKVPYEGAELHKRIPARKPSVRDVLCNWEINSQIIKMCV